jgi:hypothetical protein
MVTAFSKIIYHLMPKLIQGAGCRKTADKPPFGRLKNGWQQ